MKVMKKALSLLLAICMVLSLLPMSAFAEAVPDHEHNQDGWECTYIEPVTEKHCIHQHDGSCGYVAPTEGSPCTHVHDETCGYVEGDESSCTHVHDETCGYVEAKAEVPCTHVCSEESGCVKVVTEGHYENCTNVVGNFLAAVNALPDVTKDNAEAVGRQADAALAQYNALRAEYQARTDATDGKNRVDAVKVSVK